jgi:hypothetical protein
MSPDAKSNYTDAAAKYRFPTLRSAVDAGRPLHFPAMKMRFVSSFADSASVLRATLAVMASALLLVALPAEAQWKWKDKGGRVQYSDLPPPVGTPDQDILARPTPSRRAPMAAPAASAAASVPGAPAGASGPLVPRVVEPELEAKRKRAEADQLAKNKVEEDRINGLKADNCARARSQLRTLESGIRVARTNDKGEREFIDDKQRADETRHARDAVAADCK